jgi:hypothetical protein
MKIFVELIQVGEGGDPIKNRNSFKRAIEIPENATAKEVLEKAAGIAGWNLIDFECSRVLAYNVDFQEFEDCPEDVNFLIIEDKRRYQFHLTRKFQVSENK